jgi:hypothetical protein
MDTSKEAVNLEAYMLREKGDPESLAMALLLEQMIDELEIHRNAAPRAEIIAA